MERRFTGIQSLLGNSPAMRRVREFAARASAVDVPVLIMGETGTGKSLLARVIHEGSARGRSRMVVVNCSGVPEGLFESEFFGHQKGAFTGAHDTRRGLFEMASSGCLFLDEVGELKPPQQAKLLTVLEDGEVRRLGGDRVLPVDVRVISATSRNLAQELGAGRFRRDLFHRLAVLRCVLPPLRSRPEDIPLIAQDLLTRLQRKHGLTEQPLAPPVSHLLAGLPWAGNVRELAHTLEAALITHEEGALTPGSVEAVLHDGFPQGAGPIVAASGFEGREIPLDPGRRYSFMGSKEEEVERIRQVLSRCGGNKTRAARELGMARNTLRSRMREYGLLTDGS